MSEKREGPFRKYTKEGKPHGTQRWTDPADIAGLEQVRDANIAVVPDEFEPTKFAPDYLKRGDFKPIYRRALAVLEASQSKRAKKGFSGPYYSAAGMRKMAMTVASYHVCRHTPRSERSKDWPRDAFALAALLKLEISDVREAIYQTQYHRWEERYMPKVSQAVRVSQIKDSLLHNVLRQDEIEDPSRVNANLYRTALQAEGAMVGSQKAVQVNVNSNVLNLPEGLTEQDLKERLERVNRLAAALKPVEAEATVVEEGEPREREEHDPAGDAPRP